MLLEHSTSAPAAPPVRDLVAEANHRIANSLTTLASLVQREISALHPLDAQIAAADVRDILAGIRARLDAVARLHRTLSEIPPDAPIDAGAYLRQIASDIISALTPPHTVTLHFVAEVSCLVSSDKVLHLGLVVAELVTNSLKYAHPSGVNGKIALTCWRTAAELFVEIADDGVGFPDGLDPTRSSSGLRIVRALMGQIGGTVAFSSDDLGVTCLIRVPSR